MGCAGGPRCERDDARRRERAWSYRAAEQVLYLEGKVGHDVQVLFGQEVNLLRGRGAGSRVSCSERFGGRARSSTRTWWEMDSDETLPTIAVGPACETPARSWCAGHTEAHARLNHRSQKRTRNRR